MRAERLIVKGNSIGLESESLEGLVNSKLIRCQILNSWHISWGRGFDGIVQRQSLVLGVHHIEQSSSAERSKRSVLIDDSPCVVGNMSAQVVSVVHHCLSWNIDGSNGGEGSIGLFPLGEEVIDWVNARIRLELQLEEVAVRISSQSSSHVLSQIVWGSSNGERESNGGGVIAREQSILNGSLWKSSRAELVRRDGVIRHRELR